MIIKNLRELARTPLRKSALAIAEAGIKAVLPQNIIRENVSLRGDIFTISGHIFNLADYRRVFIFAVGKAAADSAKALEKILGDCITGGAVIDVKKYKSARLKTFTADHPLPTEKNIKAGREFIRILRGFSPFTPKDMVIVVVSGGASVLLCYPNKITYTDLDALVKKLIKKGVGIKEINTVRKHLSLIHGGYLAEYIYPGDVVALLYSDVPTSDLSVIASGPTFMDKTTVSDAKRIAKKYELGNLSFIETPKEKKYFKNIKNILICDNTIALRAMNERARELKFKSIVYSNRLQGVARYAGGKLLAKLKPGTAILAGGETTVKINHPGKGGRNQEMVLGALGYLKKNEVIISIASDGKDFIKGAGGAIADLNTLAKARKMKINPSKYLNGDNSYVFFKRIGDLILSDETGANVSDLMVALKGK